MIRALYTAATGMTAQQLNIDVIAHNLANVNTAGFKVKRAQFQDLLYQTMRSSGAASSSSTDYPVGLQVGLGSQPVSTETLFSQGDFAATNNPLDLVIKGRGFFQVRLPDGQLGFTRAGAFHLDRDGRIVNSDGYPMEPQITIPQTALSVNIGADGTVSVTQPGTTAAQQVGQIQVATFQNPAGLNSAGKNLFFPTTSSGDAVLGAPGVEDRGSLAQGFLEQSNASIVDELVSMILSQRAYETNSRVIRAADEMLTQMNGMIR
ncbi:MAG: flagellar basal-body rod protein FlgG [Acidobacteria bacterium]|nr:flagellar basal-body rod protein FlgG [Acidobacteriota bacterium]MBI3655602.1 flagellar basal-body rod protein FlgG [Acidobacteriota bacterium]